jgi:hypothetical protein
MAHLSHLSRFNYAPSIEISLDHMTEVTLTSLRALQSYYSAPHLLCSAGPKVFDMVGAHKANSNLHINNDIGSQSDACTYSVEYFWHHTVSMTL